VNLIRTMHERKAHTVKEVAKQKKKAKAEALGKHSTE
jgi:hypothetical protein